MTSLCVIPTFNEAQTIEKVVRAVLDAAGDLDLLVVDDSSPDGTGEIVAGLAAAQPRLHLLRRPVKDGLVEDVRPDRHRGTPPGHPLGPVRPLGPRAVRRSPRPFASGAGGDTLCAVFAPATTAK